LRCRRAANSALEFSYFQENFRPQNFFLVAQKKVKCAPVGAVISLPRPSEICRYDASGRGAIIVRNACRVLKVKKRELRVNFGRPRLFTRRWRYTLSQDPRLFFYLVVAFGLLLTPLFPRSFILHIVDPSLTRSCLSSLATWIPHELFLDLAPAFHAI